MAFYTRFKISREIYYIFEVIIKRNKNTAKGKNVPL